MRGIGLNAAQRPVPAVGDLRTKRPCPRRNTVGKAPSEQRIYGRMIDEAVEYLDVHKNNHGGDDRAAEAGENVPLQPLAPIGCSPCAIGQETIFAGHQAGHNEDKARNDDPQDDEIGLPNHDQIER